MPLCVNRILQWYTQMDALRTGLPCFDLPLLEAGAGQHRRDKLFDVGLERPYRLNLLVDSCGCG